MTSKQIEHGHFTVFMAAVPPDQPHLDGCYVRLTSVGVDSLEEASKVVRSFIMEHGLGSSSWYGAGENNGVVFDTRTQKRVATIAFKGRIVR